MTLVVLFTGYLGLAWWWRRRLQATLPADLQWLLNGLWLLRLGVLGIVVLLFWQPRWQHSVTDVMPAQVALVCDTSASVALPYRATQLPHSFLPGQNHTAKTWPTKATTPITEASPRQYLIDCLVGPLQAAWQRDRQPVSLAVYAHSQFWGYLSPTQAVHLTTLAADWQKAVQKTKAEIGPQGDSQQVRHPLLVPKPNSPLWTELKQVLLEIEKAELEQRRAGLRPTTTRPTTCAGLLVFSDGCLTADQTSWLEVQQLAQSLQIPIFPLLTPERQGPDAWIARIEAPPKLSKGDAAVVAVTLQSHGLTGQTARIELRPLIEPAIKEGPQSAERNPAPNTMPSDFAADPTLAKEEMDSPEIATPGTQNHEVELQSEEMQTVEFTFTADATGTYLYEVHLHLEADEIPENNVDWFAVEVTAEVLPVLMLEGEPRWDYRFLRNAAKRDPGLQVQTLTHRQLLSSRSNSSHSDNSVEQNQHSDEAVINNHRFPNFADFTTIWLGDVSPAALPAAEQRRLLAAVRERGVGLILACGNRYLPSAYQSMPLAEIFPVYFSVAPDDSPVLPFRWSLTAAGRDHPLSRLTQGAEASARLWQTLPKVDWYAPVARPRPAAIVLAEHPERRSAWGPIPLWVVQPAGRGWVAFVGIDSTWRWRELVGDRYFYRFWGQMCRWVGQHQPRWANQWRLQTETPLLHQGETLNVQLTIGENARRDMSFTLPRTLDLQIAQEPIEEILDLPPDSLLGITETAGRQPVQLMQLTRSLDISNLAEPENRSAYENFARPIHYTGQFQPQGIGKYQLRLRIPDWGEVSKETEKQTELELNIWVVPSVAEFRELKAPLATWQQLAATTGGKLLEPAQLPLFFEDLPIKSFGTTKQQTYFWSHHPLWLFLALIMYFTEIGLRRYYGLQ